MSENRPSKKSEMLEVRLSHENKRALQERAMSEGRTVSDVIREMITNYLAKSVARNPTNPFVEIIMSTKTFLISRPKSAFAAAIALFAAPLAFLPMSAVAEDVAVHLDGEYIQILGEGSTRQRSFETEVHLDLNETMTFSPSEQLGNLTVSITARTMGEGVQLEIIVRDSGQPIATVPPLTTPYGIPARIAVGHEGISTLSLKATPTRL